MSGFECFDDNAAADDDDIGEDNKITDKCSKSSFFGCYLLVSQNVKYRGKTYIGFTVSPNRRILEHNAGRMKGGAKYTAGRGPWEMVLIVYGFPNHISALRFEWAWQNPKLSRRLKHIITLRRPKESNFQYCIRVLELMLYTGPWKRLGLTIQWIKQDYAHEFSSSFTPPLHMPIAYGLVENKSPKSDIVLDFSGSCQLCSIPFLSQTANSVPIICPGSCELGRWHLLCLARYMTEQTISQSEYLLPLNNVACPACKTVDLFWPALIEVWKKRSLY